MSLFSCTSLFNFNSVPSFSERVFLPYALCLSSVVALATMLYSINTTAQDVTAPTAMFRPQTVVVQFEPDISIAGKSSTTGLEIFDLKAASYGVHTIQRAYPFLDHVKPTPETRRNLMALRRTYYVRYTADVNPERVSRDLASSPGVVYVEPLPVYRKHKPGRGKRIDPNDPRFSEQTELESLKLPQAWDMVKAADGTPPVVIAIVDDAVEWRHEDLIGNVWTNPGEIAGNGIDDDGNELIDDIHGINVYNAFFGDATNNDPAPVDPSQDHGTQVAGFASAVTDNNLGIAGAAWNAQLMHISAGDPDSGSIDGGYQGILYAAVMGADIINASWGGSLPAAYGEHFDQVLDLATDLGSLIVAAAGNEGLNKDIIMGDPDGHPRVLSVGATQKTTRTKADFSDYGISVDVFAPGQDVLTTYLNNGYMLTEGTSFSAPLVAGVAALVKTRFPEMSPDELREHIRLTSENIDAENPEFAGYLGRGFVNPIAALQIPSLPAVRVKRWSWSDSDGDHMIASGDSVTVQATLINYLADAENLRLEVFQYGFETALVAELGIGRLAHGDSTQITFEFGVPSNAPENLQTALVVRIRDGDFVDEADILNLSINLPQELVQQHRSLNSLYMYTGGDAWNNNTGWDPYVVPTEEELSNWFGVTLDDGFVVGLSLPDNNLEGILPPEIGGLANLNLLSVSNNSLFGTIPPEIGNLERLQQLWLNGNEFMGQLPRNFMQLDSLQHLHFEGQGGLCAPADDEFQTWLSSIPNRSGPTCTPTNIADNAQGALPTSFTVHGNYPNPFGESTSLVVDLPWPASLNVEVFDVVGRRVLVMPPTDLTAGWDHSIRLDGSLLPSGLYVYRVRAKSSEGNIQRRVGRFLRVR